MEDSVKLNSTRSGKRRAAGSMVVEMGAEGRGVAIGPLAISFLETIAKELEIKSRWRKEQDQVSG